MLLLNECLVSMCYHGGILCYVYDTVLLYIGFLPQLVEKLHVISFDYVWLVFLVVVSVL